MEDRIFKERQARELSFKERNKAKRRRERAMQERGPRFQLGGDFEAKVRTPKQKGFTRGMFFMKRSDFLDLRASNGVSISSREIN